VGVLSVPLLMFAPAQCSKIQQNTTKQLETVAVDSLDVYHRAERGDTN